MKIAVLKETQPNEKRIAASPETVRKLVAMGCEVAVEQKAGEAASIPDAAFEDAGAVIVKTAEATLENADLILKVQFSTVDPGAIPLEIEKAKEGAVLVGMFAPYQSAYLADQCTRRRLTVFSMEFVPRITRAQSMDVLSSQSNLAGYKAVLDAVAEYGRAVPMMMTAAGTLAPAKILILGAGVAGLQAIATARRLGAVVSAFDVRAAAKEQVESLGANFIEVPSEETENSETKGGYAREMSDAYKEKQAALIHTQVKKSDIVICTALIPGKPAPELVTEEMVADMKPGSVIIDLAALMGGNCTVTEQDKVISHKGVKVVGYTNTPSRIAEDASKLYAKNLLHFISLLIPEGQEEITINTEDEIIAASILTHEGEVVHALWKESYNAAA